VPAAGGALALLALAPRRRDLRLEVAERQTLQRAEVRRGQRRAFEAAQQQCALAALGVLGERERRLAAVGGAVG
jgi:hypothetical protein